MKYNRILCISDLHIPAHHPQAFDFLIALKKHINPDLVVNGGDELDKHALSFHDSDPDLPSAGDELRISKKYIHQLKKIFPKMILLHSNHSSLIYRRALKHGMPKAYLRSYNEFLEVDHNWKWVDDLNIKLTDGSECYFTHGMASEGLKLAMQYGIQFKVIIIQSLQFHIGLILIIYFGLSMSVVLINNKSMALIMQKIIELDL
jgi:predicted MPP superfamily phosphohydrolase